MHKLILLAALATPVAALDIAGVNLADRDKQAHVAAYACAGYVACDVLERLGVPTWLRTVGTIVGLGAVGYLYERTTGVYEIGDARASAAGGALGVGAQMAVSITVQPQGDGIGLAAGLRWRF